MTKQIRSKNRSVVACNNAVTAAGSVTQQTAPISSPKSPVSKTYRTSKISRTVRVPNELVPRVNALIQEYRERHKNDPDKWD